MNHQALTTQGRLDMLVPPVKGWQTTGHLDPGVIDSVDSPSEGRSATPQARKQPSRPQGTSRSEVRQPKGGPSREQDSHQQGNVTFFFLPGKEGQGSLVINKKVVLAYTSCGKALTSSGTQLHNFIELT